MKPVLVLLKILGLIYPTTMAFSATNHRLYLSARAPVLRAAEAHPQSPLDITRPLRDDLRQRTIDTISTLHAPAKAALARERTLLSQRRILVPVVISALAPLHRLGRSPARVALVFFLARLCTAALTQEPDPRELVPWDTTARAALRAGTLGLEASGLGLLAVLLSLAAASAGAELGVRILVARLAAALEEPPQLELATLKQAPAALWTAASGAVSSVAERVRTANSNESEAVAVATTTTTLSNSTVAAVAAAAAAPGQPPKVKAVVVPAHRADLIKLANVATRQAAAYALLAAAAGAWAAEAAFLVLLAIGQRLRLLAIASYVRGKAWMIYTIENLPRSTEDVTSSVNYQLNLIGLQAEQWMTDSWAGYLRQRRKWMSGGKGAKVATKGKGGSGMGKGGKVRHEERGSHGWGVMDWMEERKVALNQGWVRWQVDSLKEGSKRRSGGKKPLGPAAKGRQQQQQSRRGGGGVKEEPKTERHARFVSRRERAAQVAAEKKAERRASHDADEEVKPKRLVSWSFGGSHGFWNKEKVNGEAAPKAEAVEEAEKVVKGEAVAAEKVVHHEVNPNEEEPSGQRWWARFGGAGGD